MTELWHDFLTMLSFRDPKEWFTEEGNPSFQINGDWYKGMNGEHVVSVNGKWVIMERAKWRK